MKTINKIVIILSILFLNACKHDALFPPTVDPIPTIPVSNNNEICFKTDILPIMQTNCAKPGCHDDITHEKDLMLNTYDNICSNYNNKRSEIIPWNSSQSRVYEVITTTDSNEIMPPTDHLPLTQAQKDIIKKWIDQGAKNTTCTQSCDENIFTFSGAVQPIIQNRCAGCHSSPTMAGGFALTTYSEIKDVALSGKLYIAIAQTQAQTPGYTAMPYNGNKLSDCQITQIKKWIDAGTPNN
ncbi:MAG: c-type cytochrome domain-containing protein [Sphingobacteriales bacterium]